MQRKIVPFIFITGAIILLIILFSRPAAVRLGKRAWAPPSPHHPGSAQLKFKTEPLRDFPFTDEAALREWEEKIFKGKVIYSVEKDSGLSYVRADSRSAASALYYKIKADSKRRRPVLSWKWRVERFPAKQSPESLEAKNEDDFAARVYVIFLSKFIMNSKVVEYIWAEDLPIGTIGTSPYSKNIKLIVLQSGPAKDGKWAAEERDAVGDYVLVFGGMPEHDIGAISFMTNTEHTGTSADAMYDDIKLGYMKE